MRTAGEKETDAKTTANAKRTALPFLAAHDLELIQ